MRINPRGRCAPAVITPHRPKSDLLASKLGCTRNGLTNLCPVFIVALLVLLSGSVTIGAEADDWPMAAKNHASTRYSELADITADNVKRLQLAWAFSTGVNRGQEAAPIVAGDTMFVVTPYPNILYALDLKEHGKVKWKYEPKPAAAAQGVACCDVVNRGAAYDDGKVFFNTLDCHTIAVDAATGKELWKKQVGDYHLGEVLTQLAGITPATERYHRTS